MKVKLNSIFHVTVISLAFIFFMYQETPAQPKRTSSTKASAQQPASVPDISYTVSMSKPWTHLLEVEMRLKYDKAPESAEVKMPVWTPGSYLVREYARHVQDFAARDTSGKALAWEKVNKNTWRIPTGGAKEIVASYRVYSNELTVRTNELNDEHGFWNNAATLMFPTGQLAAPSTVTVKPYSNWKVATGLPAVAGQTNTFRASNFDILYDSPFEVSDYKEIKFNVQGKPHRYVITGDGNYDLNKLATDTSKIIEEAYKIFGDLPYDDYTFIVNLRGGGGLEHLNSTALQFNRFGFKPDTRYKGFLSLVAHEFFHAWNVKRIRPDVLGPFDYENENYTKLLWVAEGATAYYEGVLLRRAGLITDRELIETKATAFEQLQNRPGRFETSLEEASMDAWIKYYRQDENAVNNQISYYDKGEIVNMLLDITIRSASGGAKSLDDVMRALYNDFYKKGRNYTPADFQKASETAAGKSLDDFFAKYVRGEAELDFTGILSAIGLQILRDDSAKNRAYIGADFSEEAGRLNIRSIAADTPAYEQGLNTGDQIIAIDGYRATNAFLTSYLSEKKPGDTVKLTIFRFDKMRDMEFKLGANNRTDFSIRPVQNPTAEQQKLYRDYLKAELVKAG
ncbi:MAG TPA: PDZ domain-containing protein [Pyrinomonadaceae bacterium]|nr:PDZ domain-containing protein [Pyrinomonadaceae bacterium]